MATSKVQEALAAVEAELAALATVKAALLAWKAMSNGVAKAAPPAAAPVRRRRVGDRFLSSFKSAKGRRIGEVRLNVARFLFSENDWADYAEVFTGAQKPAGKKRFNRAKWRHLVTAHMGSLVRDGYAQTDASKGRGQMRIRLTAAGKAWLQGLDGSADD